MDTTTRERTESLIYEALHNVYDPEPGVNVIDLGLVYDVDVKERGKHQHTPLFARTAHVVCSLRMLLSVFPGLLKRGR